MTNEHETSMKRQAIIITAYRDQENLLRIIRHFADERHFRIYVHIDKRSSAIDERALYALGITSLVCVKKYSICWGSINHVKAILDLMQMALEDSTVCYFHLISGADTPLHSPAWYVKKFIKCDVSYFNTWVFKGREKESWYLRYHFPSTITPRYYGTSKIHALSLFCDKWLCRIQNWLGVRRKRIGDIPAARFRLGLVWGSFTRDACREFVQFRDGHPRFLRALNYTVVPEELYFATVISEKRLPVSPQGNMRFSVWAKNRGFPAVLFKEDFEAMYRDDYFFARKVDTEKSATLLQMIAERIGLEDRHSM